MQHPTTPHQVWHLDITTLRVLWKRFEIAAIVDGFTRKIVGLRTYAHRPTTDDLVKLVEDAINEAAERPGFLVTDHGSQFRRRFREAVEEAGITHIRCQVRTWHLNAKVERVFRDIKGWAHRSTLLPMTDAVQARLDGFRDWHNGFKPHAAHDTLTPNEAEERIPPATTTRYFQKGGVEPTLRLERRCVRGDPRLCYPVIDLVVRPRNAARGSAQSPGPLARTEHGRDPEDEWRFSTVSFDTYAGLAVDAFNHLVRPLLIVKRSCKVARYRRVKCDAV